MSSCCLFDYILELNLSALESEPAEQAALTIYRSERTPPDRQRGEGRGAYSKDAVIFAPKDSLHAWQFKERAREHKLAGRGGEEASSPFHASCARVLKTSCWPQQL